MRRQSSGFTLIELLVVIAIIAILAAILFPVFMSAKETGRKATCVSNMRNIGFAYALYLGDSNGRYPSNHFGANLFLIEPYLKQMRFKKDDGEDGKIDTSVWLCPTAGMKGAGPGRLGCYYNVQPEYWGSQQNTPWWKRRWFFPTMRVFNSYVVNADVTMMRKPNDAVPAMTSAVGRASQVVFLAESCYNPDRLSPTLGTTPTATHPSDDGPWEVDGWYPGYPNSGKKFNDRSNVEAWHNGGANFMYADYHVVFSTQVPPIERWQVR